MHGVFVVGNKPCQLTCQWCWRIKYPRIIFMTSRPSSRNNPSYLILTFLTNMHTVYSSMDAFLPYILLRDWEEIKIIWSIVANLPHLFPKEFAYKVLTSVLQNLYCSVTLRVLVQLRHTIQSRRPRAQFFNVLLLCSICNFSSINFPLKKITTNSSKAHNMHGFSIH